ncbi:hypothetical protein MKX01_011410 [Papaver californicum]|nr:hypothetical protein MKX01_011410 [Papaver californicum]
MGSLLFRYPWDLVFGRVSDGTITVAGDAMHPMTPDLGQGGCASLEDAVVLGRDIGNSYIRNGGMISQEDLEVEIEMYVKERRWRTSGLITASYLSGWVQQTGSGGIGSSSIRVGWLMKFLRDTVFIRLFIPGSVVFYIMIVASYQLDQLSSYGIDAMLRTISNFGY